MENALDTICMDDVVVPQRGEPHSPVDVFRGHVPAEFVEAFPNATLGVSVCI